jgi:hypothetical protein
MARNTNLKARSTGRAVLAQEAAALCDEILSLRTKYTGVVGEQRNMTGPSGITGRMGSAFDGKWEAFANDIDDLAGRLAVKVKALDPMYPVGQFYEAKPQPWIARVPGGRVKMPDHERESLRELVANLHREKPQNEIEKLQAVIIASIETADTQRARSSFTKPQWPGAVTDFPTTWQIAEPRFAERGDGTKRAPLLWQVPREDEKLFYQEVPGHRMFQSWPETAGDWEQRFKTVLEWAMAQAWETTGQGGAPINRQKTPFPWGRAILCSVIFCACGASAILIAWLWEEGQNLIQKVGNGLWLFAPAFGISSVASALILGKEAWSRVRNAWQVWKV